MWHILFTILAFVLIFAETGTSLQCYHCHVKPKPRKSFNEEVQDRLCSDFDGSDRFLINCTHSTYCRTRTYSISHNMFGSSEEMLITERGCAKQSYSYQTLIRGKWKTVTDIMDTIQEEVCFRDYTWADRLGSGTEYCYCNSDRCNLQPGSHKKSTEFEVELLDDKHGTQQQLHGTQQQLHGTHQQLHGTQQQLFLRSGSTSKANSFYSFLPLVIYFLLQH